MNIKTIAFDADDTLWDNEGYFLETEKKFCTLLEDYLPHHTLSRELLKTEINNLTLYGYGIKGFMLSMIETAITVTDKTIPVSAIETLITLGQELLLKPVTIMEGVEDVLKSLQNRYKLVLATKGDLLDQHRKLHKSGLGHYFHHIEIMTEKKEEDYQKLIKRLDIQADEFLMIGNSLKSDVLPVLNIGGHAIHVPYHTTWEHEKVEVQIKHVNFRQVGRLGEITQFLKINV
jgi:putative hydrolase of the HAD superfamily